MSTKRYRVGEKVYNIPLDKVSPFKQVYPNAVEENDNESGNSNDVVMEDASATSDQNMASTSDDGSSDLQQVEMGPPEFDNETLFLNLEDQIDNKDQKKEFVSEVNVPNVTIEAPKDELFFDVSDVIGKSEQDIVRRLEEISNKNEKYQGYEFSSTVFDFTPQVKIKNKETGEQTKVFLNKNDFTSTLASISDFVLGDNSVKDNALIQESINSVFNLYKNEDETVEEFVDRATPTVKSVSYSDRKPMQRTPTTTQYQIDAYLKKTDKVTSIGNINKLEGSDGEIIYYKGSDIRLKASKKEIQQFEALAYHNKFYAQSMAVKNEMLSEDLQNASLVTLTSVLAGTEDDVAFTQDVEVDFDEGEFARDDVQQNDYSYLDHQIYISERIVNDFTKSFIEAESILMSEYEAGYKVEQGKYKKQVTNALDKVFESELSYYDQLGKSQIKIITDQELSSIRREVDAGIWEGYSEDQLNDILSQRISEKYDAFNDSLTKTDRFKAFQKEYSEAYNNELLDLTSEWRESQLEIIQKSYDNAFEKYKENYKPSFDKIDQQELQNVAYALDTRHNFRNLSYLEQVHLIDSYWNGMSALLAEDPAINGQEEIDEIKREYYGYFYETELSNAKKRGQQSNFIRKSMVREFYQSSKIQLDKLVDEYMLANPYESYLQKSKEEGLTITVSEEKYRSLAFDHIKRGNRTLVKTIENSADILNSDDPQELMQNSEIKNFWLGLTSGNFSEAVPFLSGVLDLGETYDLYKISKVPEAERTQIQNMYVALNAIESQHQEALKTVSENFAVGQSVKQSIPFFLEIAITGGAYTAAKNSTVKGIKSGLLKGSKGRFKKGTDELLFVKKGAKYKIVDNASEVLGVINGSIAQTMVNPQRWLDATYKNLTPTMSFMLTEEAEPLLGKLGLTTFTPEGGEAKDDNILKAWLRGTGTTWSSYVTEKSGMYYGKAASRLGRPVNAQWQKAVNNNDFLRRLTGGWIMTKYGNVSNFLQRNIGLDGFFGEFLEEIQEIPMSNIINGDITLQGIYKYDQLGRRLGLDVENLRFTAKSVAGGQLLFKGGGFALNGGYSLTQRNKKITYEIEGEKFKDEEDFNSALFSLEENGLLTDETKITIKNDYSAVDNTVEVLERNGVSTDIINTGPTKLSEGDYVTANEVEIMNEIQDGDHGGKTAKEIREELAEKEKEIVKLKSEITSLDNSEIPTDQKNKDKSRLKQKVRSITVQINDILKKAKDRANVKKREPIYQRALDKIRNLLPSDTKIVEFNNAEELGNKYIKDKHNASRKVDQAPLSTAGKVTYINNADNTEITDPELIKQIEADYNEAVNSGQGAFNSVNNEILINKEKALLGGNVNVTAHEFLHRMLKTSLENNPELRIAFGEALYSHLRMLNPKGIKDKNFRGRLAAYNNKSKAEQMEEVMTLFSDAIVNGTMTYDATFAEKIGDIIRRIMQSLGVQITFEKPEDVFNFIRDYNKSIAKGELTRSQKQLLSGKQTIQAGGQIQVYADQQKKEIKKISKKTGLSIEQLDQAGLRFSKESEASRKVQEIYDEQGEAGMFEIFEQFKPITTRIARRFRDVPGYDEQLIIDEIETGNRGIIDLIRDYKPESGVPLAAYINKFLPARSIEAGNRILKTEFEDDITEARGVAAEETVEQQPERKTKLKVLADQLNVGKQVDGAVANADVDVTSIFSFKSVPNAVAETVGELMGISPAKIKSKANLTKSELASAQRFIKKNVGVLIGMMPEGFDSSGKATGVPKTMLDAFYTKRESRAKTKAGLQTQVKRSNIKDSEFLEIFNIFEGVPDRSDRNTSARVIALADLMGKVMTNQSIRKQNPSVVSIADGMSKIMFSKEIDLNKLEGINKTIEWGMQGGFASQPKSYWMKGLHGSGAKNTNITEDGKQVYLDENNNKTFKKTKTKLKRYPLKTGGSILNNDPNFSESTINHVPASKGIFANAPQRDAILNKYEEDGGKFLPASETYQAASDRTTVYGKKTGEQVKALINKNQDKFNKSEKGFIDYWLNIKEDVKNNPKNEKYWAALLEVTSTNQSSFMRVGSRLIGYNTLGLENREEHMSPASDFAKYLFQGVKDGWLTRKQMKQAMKSYTQISLPLIYDEMLSGIGVDGKPFDYTKVLPEEFAGLPIKIQILQGMIPNWIRYINPNVNAMPYTLNGKQYYGMNPNVLVLGDGRNLAQTYSLGVDSSLEMNQDVISVQQELLFKVFMNNITKAEAVSQLNDYVSNMTPAASSILMFSKDIDANKANVNPKGITILDFDDTLATTKSGIRYEMPNPSGKPQPGRKVIFMAGAPGAGKSTVIKGLDLLNQGFKIVNQDIALERLMKESEMPTDMREMTPKDLSTFGRLSGQARKLAGEKRAKYKGQGEGMIIDGTGASLKVMEKAVKEFKEAGYDVQMVFVETTMETAVARNKARKERSLKTGIVKGTWEKVIANKEAYKNMFGERFAEIKTDNIQYKDAMPADLIKKLDSFTKGYIKGRINAEQFASQGQTLLGEGAEFDFSEFNKVVEGKTAPLFNKAMKLQGKFGPENMFVLTARPAEAQGPIFEFLKANGLNIPLKNITGLGNSTAEAKALWVAGKFSEGYNDFYFADDAIQNVKAVDNILEQFDVKRKVQQAKIKFSKDLDPKFNQMLERSAGVGAQKIFSRVEAAKRGKNKGRFTFFVPPSAEDFTGLLRYFAGTGKQGDADIQFFNEALVKPFARADRAMSQMKQTIRDDYSALRKKFPEVKKKLGKLIEGTTFTNDMAIRVYLFDKAGYETPGLSKQGKAKLINTVKGDPEMRAFADALGIISKQKDGYLKPGEYWNTENIALDLQNATNKVGRKQFLQEWVQNKEIIFSPANMNKIEAVYGTQFREALEDILFRMENGTNRSKGKTYGQGWTNWVNNSVGAIMFFNGRSAVLQTLSTVNFINFEDNNIFAAGKAFANQKQYWSDFSFLFNSDFLRNRRAGLATNVNEAELASAVAGATNKAKAALGYLLKIGFTPTQIADSFAIASGGATYYRNRIKTYLKSGMSQDQAENRAMLDFQEIAEETQQSARPDRISQQQASNLGRIILAFANTPMQYNRLIKKAAGDLVNKRGDWRSNVSRILYYGAIQNFIFASLQNALFALAFDEDDEELTESQQAARDRKEDTKNSRILNSMFDSLARGSGVYGAALATIKNAILEFYEQDAKGFRADYNQVVIELLNVSPPLGSKARKLASAGYTRKVEKDVMQEMSMLDYDNPAWQAITNVVEATTNIPMARVIRKADNLREAFNQENSAMQRVFLALGWSAWDLDVGTEVVKNEGKKNEYVVTLDTKRMKQYEVEKKIDERKTEERREEAKKNKIKKKEKEDKKNQQEVKANIEKQKEEGDDATCAAISSKGNRCKRKLVAGKSFCTVHEKVEKSQSGEMKQCKKIKSDGNRCGIKTNSKSGLCYYHD